jgi:hypothetical protein
VADRNDLADKLFRAVQANVEALDGCPGPHEFVREDARNERCKKCGGVASAISVFWYRQGLRHGDPRQR